MVSSATTIRSWIWQLFEDPEPSYQSKIGRSALKDPYQLLMVGLHAKLFSFRRRSVFSETHGKEIGQFSLLQEDWDVLKWLAPRLKVFWTQTQRLQGKAKLGHHGAIWEALPAMEYLLEHLEQLNQGLRNQNPVSGSVSIMHGLE